jgi:integrase
LSFQSLTRKLANKEKLAMASIFKRRKGKNVPYTIQYVDHLGNRKTVQGFTDKGLSEHLAAKLESEARLRKTGLVDPELDRLNVEKARPIVEQLSEFESSIADNSAYYIEQLMFRVRRIIDGCDFSDLRSIAPEKTRDFLRGLRINENLGHKTYNHYLQAMDTFLNWCVRTGRMLSNPLKGLERLNTEVDIRHQRRALTPDEMQRLISAAKNSGKFQQEMSPDLRAKLYLFAYLTGLRKSEIASLRAKNFQLDENPPRLLLQAISSKHRKNDTLPLHPDLVAMLREWLPMIGGDYLFPNLSKKRMAEVIQSDLKRAGIPYKTDEGIADFHAAGRHTYITQLIRSGASLPEAKELARHSEIKMTLRYTHIGIVDQAKALANLPTTQAALHERCTPGGAASLRSTMDGTDEDRSSTICQEKTKDLTKSVAQGRSLSSSKLVVARGVEPRRLSAPDPKSGVSANFTKRPIS